MHIINVRVDVYVRQLLLRLLFCFCCIAVHFYYDTKKCFNHIAMKYISSHTRCIFRKIIQHMNGMVLRWLCSASCLQILVQQRIPNKTLPHAFYQFCFTLYLSIGAWRLGFKTKACFSMNKIHTSCSFLDDTAKLFVCIFRTISRGP